MAVRLNTAEITHFDDDDRGVMTVTAIARHVDVLRYRSDSGDRLELVPPDLIRGYDDDGRPHVAQLAGATATNEHPLHGLIADSDEIRNSVEVGKALPKVKVYKDDRAEVTIEVYDSETQDAIRRGEKRGLSVGYRCNVIKQDGVWKGKRYTHIQQPPFHVDHIAIVANPRAPEALISRFDSDDLEDVAWQVDAAENFTTDKDDSAMTYTVTVEGRPIILDSADDAQAINKLIAKLDAKGKGKKMPVDPDAGEEDMEGEPDDEDAEMPFKKMKKKMDELEADAAAKQARIDSLTSELEIANQLIKKDSETPETTTNLDADEVNRLVQERFDSVLTAYNDAIESKLLTPDDVKLDGTSTEISIKRAAVLKYAPEMKLDNDAQVEGAYRGLKQFGGNTRKDSSSDRPAVVRVDGMGGNCGAPTPPKAMKKLAYSKRV